MEVTFDTIEKLNLLDKSQILEKWKKTVLLYQSELIKEICIDDFCLLKLLGKGAFGSVYLANKLDNPNEYVAIKMLKKIDIIKQN